MQVSVRDVLEKKFPSGEYVLISEVSDTSGHSRSRSLDYMLINLWQSRGLAITGIELKSWRNDWLKELKNPQKQEKHFKYCDFFCLLTNREGVAKLDEIPASWGWWHINEKGILKTMKPAPKQTPEPVHRSLLCAMLRRAASKEKFIHIDTIESRIAEEAEKRIVSYNAELEADAKEYKFLKEKVDAFELASGIKINDRWSFNGGEKIGKTLKFIMNHGVEKYEKRLIDIKNQAGIIMNDIKKKLDELKIIDEQALESDE